MSSDSEKGRRAIDTMVKSHIEHAQKNGKQLSDSEARKFVTQVAERAEKRAKKTK
jgi:hypothetical protein